MRDGSARGPRPGRHLAEVTGGELARSPRYERIYRPLDWADECRGVFRTDTSCRGYVAPVRAGAAGRFERAAVELVRELAGESPAMCARPSSAPRCWPSGAPAVVILTADDAVESVSEGKREWLADVGGDASPKVLRIAASRAHAGPPGQPPLRARGGAGGWFAAEAAALVDTGGKVAVTIRPARSGELLPILLDVYGLTERETEIVLELATKTIAARLCISAHTVRDHVKAIFEKVGATAATGSACSFQSTCSSRCTRARDYAVTCSAAPSRAFSARSTDIATHVNVGVSRLV